MPAIHCLGKCLFRVILGAPGLSADVGLPSDR
jgi:hypothetical protein